MFLKEDIRGILNCTLWNTILKNITKVVPVIKKRIEYKNELYLLKDFYHYIN